MIQSNKHKEIMEGKIQIKNFGLNSNEIDPCSKIDKYFKLRFENHQRILNNINEENNKKKFNIQVEEEYNNSRNLNMCESPIYSNNQNNTLNSKATKDYNYLIIKEHEKPEFNAIKSNPKNRDLNPAKIHEIRYSHNPGAEIVECKLKIFRRNSMSSKYSYLNSNLENYKETSFSNDVNQNRINWITQKINESNIIDQNDQTNRLYSMIDIDKKISFEENHFDLYVI